MTGLHLTWYTASWTQEHVSWSHLAPGPHACLCLQVQVHVSLSHTWSWVKIFDVATKNICWHLCGVGGSAAAGLVPGEAGQTLAAAGGGGEAVAGGAGGGGQQALAPRYYR